MVNRFVSVCMGIATYHCTSFCFCRSEDASFLGITLKPEVIKAFKEKRFRFFVSCSSTSVGIDRKPVLLIIRCCFVVRYSHPEVTLH